MEAKQTIQLHSNDIQVFFRIHLGKDDLFACAMQKILWLNNLAKKQHVYAYLFLLRIKLNIDNSLDSMGKEIKRINKLIKNRYGEKPDIRYPVKDKLELSFSDPIMYRLIYTLIQFDELNCLLATARNMEIFTNQEGFFHIKNKYKYRFFKLLWSIINIRIRNLPMININDYLNNEETYKEAEKTLGSIDPQELYTALHLSSTPLLRPQDINLISKRLKMKTKEK